MSSAVITLNKTNLLLSIPEVLVRTTWFVQQMWRWIVWLVHSSCARVLVCSCTRVLASVFLTSDLCWNALEVFVNWSSPPFGFKTLNTTSAFFIYRKINYLFWEHKQCHWNVPWTRGFTIRSVSGFVCFSLWTAEVLKVLLEQNVSKGAWVGLFFSVTHRGRTKRYALVQSL